MIALVAVFALPGGIAQAETVVSNIGQSTVTPRAIVSSTQSQAQAFTTGSAAGGYELESVDLEVLNFVGTTSHISVSIYSEASGEPGSEVHALSNPSTIAGNGVRTFTAPANATLGASTTYFVVISSTDSQLLLRRTAASAEDTGGATGWSIANNRQFNSGTGWGTTVDTIKIRVKDTTVDNTPPALDSAELNAATEVRLVFDEALVSGSVADKSAFFVTVEGNPRTIDSRTLNSAGTTITLVVDPGIRPGDTVKVSYRKPSTKPLKDGEGNEVASFTDRAVANNLAPIAPEAPTNLHAKGVSATQIGLSWSAPEYTGGADITGYRIEVSNDGNTGWTELVASQTSRTYSHTVTSGATRYYRVSAINSAGTGPVSNVASASAMDTPPTVTGAEIKQRSRTVRLLFDESLDSTSTPAASAFTVTVEGNARTPDTATILASPPAIQLNLPLAVDAVRPGETVTVSYTNPGTNPLQDAAGAETASFTDFPVDNNLAPIAPEAPTNLHAKGVSATQIGLSWSAPEYTGGADITGYRIEVSNDGNTGWTELVASQTSRTYSHTVTSGATRYYRVSAINSAGTGPVSNVASASAMDTPPTVTGAEIKQRSRTVRLLFDESLDSTSTPAASAFTVTVEGNARTPDTATILASPPAIQLNLPLAVDAVRPGETVTVSYTKPGTNPLRDAANNQTASFTDFPVANNLAATAPEAPGNLAASPGTDAGTMDLTWDTPWANGSDITKFQVRHAEGSSPGGTWGDIDGSGATTTSHTVTGLTDGTEYTFQVRAVNGEGDGDEGTVTARSQTPEWRFTLRDSNGNNVTELTEGGDSATATVSITNNVRFGTPQTVTLAWGGLAITSGSIVGAGGTTTVTILAGQSSGSLEISSPQISFDDYDSPVNAALTARHGGTEIGSIALTRLDDEAPPVASITQAPTTVDEGETIVVEVGLNLPFSSASLSERTIKFVVNDADGALGGTPPTSVVFGSNNARNTVTLTTADNSTQNDGAREVTFALQTSPDSPYTLGDTSSVTITVRDNDTPPLAPENLRAQAGNTEAHLSWRAPPPSTPDHGQPVLHYEYRVKAGMGSFGNWAMIPGGDASTTSHTFTGLPNDTLHTYEVAAVNVAGRGAAAQESVTPIDGVAVSFGAASLSVDEGGSATVTLTLAEAPTASVTVPLVAAPGAGLDSNDYSGVPASVTFNAGETSKSFEVTAEQDTDDEPDERLTLSLGLLPHPYIPGTPREFVLTVVDDDHPIVSATFGRAAASVTEGGSVEVTVNLSQAPEREVVLPITATRGANLAGAEVEGVPASVTFAPNETQARFTVKFKDDTVVEGNETLTLTFGTYPEQVQAGANPRLVLTVTDDDGPPAAPDVSAQTGDGYVTLSWTAVSNDSPVLRYEVRWRETDGGTFGTPLDVGLVTRYRVEGLTNGTAYEFQVHAVNAHGDGEAGSAPGTPTARLTGIPKAVQVLQVKATDSGRAELSWTRPANATDRVTRNSASATFSQLQGYRIEVCRTACGDEANWYAVVPNTRAFEHKYVHQVLAPGVIRENRYRVRAININGKTGPWSNVATLEPTVVESFWLQTPDDSTLWLRFRVLNPDGNKLYVRYENTGTGAVAYTERRLTKKGDVKLVLSGLDADSWYRVDVDFDENFGSSRMQSRWYGTARAGHTPLRSPYAVDALDAQVFAGGVWREAPDNALRVRMGETGKYRVRLKPCQGIHDVIVNRIQSPAGRLRASPMDVDPSVMINLSCESEFDDWRRDENGDPFTMDQIYDMTNFPDRANDRIPIYAGTPNNWKEVTVTARALENYPADRRYDALLSAPFAVVYNHSVHKEVTTTSSYLVSEGTGLVRILVDRPADAVLPEPTGVAIADPVAGGFGNPVMSWNAVSGASGYLVEWRHGVHYSDRANQNRSLQTATSVTLPLGASRRGPITARVRAYSSSGVSAWSVERSWDTRRRP